MRLGFRVLNFLPDNISKVVCAGPSERTHHWSAKEFLSIQSSHRLCRRLDVAKYNVCLAAHGHGLERDNIEDGAVRGEQHVEGCAEICFLDFRGGKICDVETI